MELAKNLGQEGAGKTNKNEPVEEPQGEVKKKRNERSNHTSQKPL